MFCPASLPPFPFPASRAHTRVSVAGAKGYIIHVWIPDAMTPRKCCYGLQGHTEHTSPKTYTCQKNSTALRTWMDGQPKGRHLNWKIQGDTKKRTFEMRSGSHVQLAALRNRDLLSYRQPPETGIGGVENKKVTSKCGYRYQRLDGEACISCPRQQVSATSQVTWSPWLRARTHHRTATSNCTEHACTVRL